MTEKLRLSGPAALAASIPSLLGFAPAAGDVVVIALAGRRVGMTARMDDVPADRPAAARQLARAVKQGSPDVTAVVVIVYGTDRHAPHDWSGALWTAGLGTAGAYRVHDGRLFADFGDTTGEALGENPTHTALAVLTGTPAPAADRATMVARLDARPGGADTADRNLLGALQDVDKRDALLAVAATLDGAELGIRLDAAVKAAGAARGVARDLALVHVAALAYLSGNGVLAREALDRVREMTSLGRLLARALDATAPPELLRAAFTAA